MCVTRNAALWYDDAISIFVPENEIQKKQSPFSRINFRLDKKKEKHFRVQTIYIYICEKVDFNPVAHSIYSFHINTRERIEWWENEINKPPTKFSIFCVFNFGKHKNTQRQMSAVILIIMIMMCERVRANYSVLFRWMTTTKRKEEKLCGLIKRVI